MKLACAKCVYLLMSVAFLLISNNVFAGTTSTAQAALSSSGNNVCPMGDGRAVDPRIEKDKPKENKGECEAGQTYVQCLRSYYNAQTP